MHAADANKIPLNYNDTASNIDYGIYNWTFLPYTNELQTSGLILATPINHRILKYDME